MIELRNFFTRKECFDSFGGEIYKRLVMVLQYRQTINDNEPTSDRLWSEWTDVPDVYYVPDVYGEEKQ